MSDSRWSTPMKRLAAVVVAGSMVVTSGWAQYARVWTNPAVPATDVLDRLNLRLGWRAGLPFDGYRDGIATVQNLGDLIIVQSRRGAVAALDPVTGAARWRTAVGLPYPVTHAVGYSDAVILVANGTRIFGLDRPTGNQLWSVDLAGTPSSPPSANADGFYVVLGNGRLSAYAFPVESGPAPGTSAAAVAGAAKEPVIPGGSAAAVASGSGAVRALPVPARPSATGGGVATANPPKPAAGGGGRTVTVSGAVGNRSATTSIQV